MSSPISMVAPAPTVPGADVVAAVTRRVFGGRVPLCIFLEDVASSGDIVTAPPFYILAPRMSYLPLITPQATMHLMPASLLTSLPTDTEFWYSFNDGSTKSDVPLRWHLPIGLLYDQYRFGRATASKQNAAVWNIKLRYTNFPADKVFRIRGAGTGGDVVSEFFMAQLKQSDFIRNGSSKRMMSLSKKDQTSLWESLLSGDHDRYWDANLKLLNIQQTTSATAPSRSDSPSTPPSSSTAESSPPSTPTLNLSPQVGPKSVPMRVYVYDRPVIQEVVPPRTADGADITLVAAMRRLLPDLFPVDGGEQARGAVVWLHGVPVPLDVPLLWLSRNMSYADNFLHLVVGNC